MEKFLVIGEVRWEVVTAIGGSIGAVLCGAILRMWLYILKNHRTQITDMQLVLEDLNEQVSELTKKILRCKTDNAALKERLKVLEEQTED